LAYRRQLTATSRARISTVNPVIKTATGMWMINAEAAPRAPMSAPMLITVARPAR